MSMPAGQPTLLLGCFFPRSVELEGVGTFISGLAEGLALTGRHVRLLMPEGWNRPIRGVQILCYRRGPAGFAQYVRAIRVQSSQADAVLLVENNPNMALVARWSRRPEATWCYFYTPLQPPGLLREAGLRIQGIKHLLAKHSIWRRLGPWRQLRCVVATRFQAEQLAPFSPAELHVLPGGSVSRAEPFPDRQAARVALGWPADRPVIGYLGHFSPAKGVAWLLEAALPADYTIALAHSGKGRLGARGAAMLDNLRGRGRLIEHGIVDAPTFLAACDVVALPYVTSSIHHLPQVMVESFAAQTAVVASAVGGLADIHTPGLTGASPAPRNSAALRAAIAEALSHELASGHRMGRNARAVFEASLCREVFCEKLLRLMTGGPG